MKKNIKVSFEIILRDKKTGKEIKIKDISIPVNFTVNKELLHKIMKENLEKEDK